MNDYPHLPANCRNGHCDHETGRCLRYRSRRCLSGQCTHARQNLLCAVNYPTADQRPHARKASRKEPMNLDRDASAIAAAAAEEVRALNHRTFDTEAFSEPADVYRTVSNLTRLVQGLPQAIEQTWKRLRMMEQDAAIRMDNGANIQEEMENARQQLGHARRLLAEAGSHLDRATQTLSHMGGQ